MYHKILLIIYSIYLLIFSLISFSFFLLDKKKAENEKSRIKEKDLLLSAIFGGAIGAFLGRIVASHKTKKVYFSIVIYFSLIMEIAIFVLLLIKYLAR